MYALCHKLDHGPPQTGAQAVINVHWDVHYDSRPFPLLSRTETQGGVLHLMCLLGCLAPYIGDNLISLLVPFCILQRIITMYEMSEKKKPKKQKTNLSRNFLKGDISLVAS